MRHITFIPRVGFTGFGFFCGVGVTLALLGLAGSIEGLFAIGTTIGSLIIACFFAYYTDQGGE